jgi:DtxR family Mn-dependent transcriptional regulator
MLSFTEENYLKAIYKIHERTKSSASTNAIAEIMATTAASVTDMMRKLSQKEMIQYEKYKGARLTAQGAVVATALIRRHRLWETFLADKLNFSWEEVHELAEQLEHIKSEQLIERLDEFLDFPKYDPHGDPIPNADGKFTIREQFMLSQLQIGEKGVLIGVKNHNDDFLSYLNELKIKLGSEFEIVNKVLYDQSIKVKLMDDEIVLTEKVSNNLMIKKLSR